MLRGVTRASFWAHKWPGQRRLIGGKSGVGYEEPWPGAGSASGMRFSALSSLPTLSTQDLERIMELQRMVSSVAPADDPPSQNSAEVQQVQQDSVLPELLTRLSTILANHSSAGLPEASSTGMSLGPLARYQPAASQQDALANPGAPPEAQMQMPLRFSGRVSGILDDLSDAMSMLNELLPSAASEGHIQMQASEQNPAGPDSSVFTSVALPKIPQMNLVGSAEGSNGVSHGGQTANFKRSRIEAGL